MSAQTPSRDPHAQHAARPAQAIASEERYQAFIQNSHEGIWCFELEQPIPIDLDPAEQIERVYRYAYLAEANNAMAAMYGLQKPEQLVGARLGDLLPKDDPQNIEYLLAFIASGYTLSGVESHEVDHAGNPKTFRNSLVGVIQGDAVVRAWGTQQDVTDQYQAEQALRKSQEHLALALKASRMGSWEWNVRTNELTWSDERKVLFGLKPEDDVTYRRFIEIIHPQDRKNAQAVIDHALKNGEEYRMEFRVVWPDGSVHWLLSQGKALVEAGKPLRVIGTSMNIDDLKRAEELKAANENLRIQSEQLLAFNAAKDEFISLASHQLRTPSAIVKQYVGMLLQGYAGEMTPQQTEFLQIAYDNNQRGLEIVDDLLKVARIDAGRVVLQKTQTNLNNFLQQIVTQHAADFKSRGQHITFEHPERHVLAMVDAARLRMVLENLIDNAAKYSKKGKTTTVRLESRHGQVVISVSDQGVGIAKKDLPKLFQKFSRIENTLSMLEAGTGIGLYWAKKIIDLHQGTIEVQSRLHKGSTFFITLPKK
jgi:PAS domain S-box-containing protein